VELAKWVHDYAKQRQIQSGHACPAFWIRVAWIAIVTSHQIANHIDAFSVQVGVAKIIWYFNSYCYKLEKYLVSRTTGSSPRTNPTRKCCCLNSAVRSAKAALSPPTSVERKDDWLFDDETEGLGDAGPEVGANGLMKGRLSAMKCSWLHTILSKSICLTF
jgi:hypothetical protein